MHVRGASVYFARVHLELSHNESSSTQRGRQAPRDRPFEVLGRCRSWPPSTARSARTPRRRSHRRRARCLHRAASKNSERADPSRASPRGALALPQESLREAEPKRTARPFRELGEAINSGKGESAEEKRCLVNHTSFNHHSCKLCEKQTGVCYVVVLWVSEIRARKMARKPCLRCCVILKPERPIFFSTKIWSEVKIFRST